ncbi:MAG: hypothetical protein LBD68_04940 [Zoogloeaceae bacterium]|jgi:hypothetical protein|nr:hypothetical protein [Zoogloeaceae bacterium]
MDYTARQIMLFYREAIRHENAEQAGRILAANLGFSGGKAAQRAVKELLGGKS